MIKYMLFKVYSIAGHLLATICCTTHEKARCTNSQRGFTLIEMIGVLTIIAIIASAIVPNIAKQVTRAIADAEDIELRGCIDALKQFTSVTRKISGVAAGQWNNDIAQYLESPASKILNNKASGTRRMIVRPTNGLPGIPYDQTVSYTSGVAPEGVLPTVAPLQARMIIVSNLGGTAPALAVTDAQFDAIWDQVGAIPPGFLEDDKLRIERLNFTRSFYPVTVSCQAITGVPRWSIDAAIVKSLNANTTFTVHLIAGTRVNLFVGGAPIGTLVVKGPLGVLYNGISWSY